MRGKKLQIFIYNSRICLVLKFDWHKLYKIVRRFSRLEGYANIYLMNSVEMFTIRLNTSRQYVRLFPFFSCFFKIECRFFIPLLTTVGQSQQQRWSVLIIVVVYDFLRAELLEMHFKRGHDVTNSWLHFIAEFGIHSFWRSIFEIRFFLDVAAHTL